VEYIGEIFGEIACGDIGLRRGILIRGNQGDFRGVMSTKRVWAQRWESQGEQKKASW